MIRKITKHQVALLLIIAAAAFLRLKILTLNSLWWDEMLCMRFANPANSFSDILRICKEAYHPAPGTYYIILNSWMHVFGYSDFSARLLVALLGIAAIPVMYLLGKELNNKNTGVIAAAITAVNYFHIYYSLDVHYYALLFLLSACSYLLFIRSLRQSSYLNLGLYFFTTLLMMLVHHFSILIFAAQGLTWLYLCGPGLFKDFKKQLPLLVTFALAGVAYLPFLSRFLEILELKNLGIYNPGTYFYADYFAAYFGYSGIGVMPALAGLVFFILSAFLLAGGQAVEKVKQNTALILFTWLLFPLVAAYIRTVTSSPAILDRYTIVVLPALLLAIACGADAIKNVSLKYAFIGLFLTASVTVLLEKKMYSQPIKDDFKGVANYIRDHQDTASFYLVSDKNWCFKYYMDQYGVQPKYIDHVEYSDARFYVTDRLFKNEWLVIDTNLKDMWVASAHYGNMKQMRALCDTLMLSDRFIEKEYYESYDAFAKHYIRKY